MLAGVLWVIGISGCAEQRTLDDLELYVATLHRDKVPEVDPLPEEPPVVEVTYAVDQAADPFAPRNVFGTVAIAADTRPGTSSVINPRPGPDPTPEVDPLTPNPNRQRDPLEEFPLDTLKLLGTMNLEREYWALVSAPDGQIHKVVVGSFLGQNMGKVVSIDETERSLQIEELVKGPSGRWELRFNELKSGG